MELPFANLFKRVKSDLPTAPSKVVGIDIGSASVKVVELENTEAAVVLKSYGELQLGPYAEKALGEVADPAQEKKVEAVIDVVREAGISAKDGTLAIPLHTSFVTVIPLTVADGEDMTAKLPVEARKYIPVPLTDVSLDWRELESEAGANTNVREVLIVAVENAALARHRDLMRMTGLKAQPSEIEVFSSIRALWSQQDSVTAVIDLGARTSKLYIAKNGLIERVHRVAAGGAQITRKLAELQSISFEEAENLKRTTTLEDNGRREVLKATEATLGNALQEFKRIIDQYEIRYNDPVNRIAVTGGVSTGAGVKEIVANTLAREIEAADAFAKIAYPAFMEDTLRTISPSFHVAVGAALRQLE